MEAVVYEAPFQVAVEKCGSRGSHPERTAA